MALGKTVKRIDISSLEHDGNPRTADGMKLDKLMASYETHGYQADSTIMVEEKGDKFLVLRGNRRTLAALEIRDKNQDLFARVFPDGKIPAVVAKSLTDQERILLRIDHSGEMDREPLSDEGMFNAVCQLCRVSLTQEEIAEHLNLWSLNKKTNKQVPNRSLVQRRVELAKLPQKVIDEFRILMQKGTSETPVRWSMVSTLYKKYKKNHIEYPNGDIEFNTYWEKCTTPVEDKKADSPRGSLTAKKAEDLSMQSQSEGARALLLTMTGQGNDTFADLDVVILKGEQAVIVLDRIKIFLGNEDYNTLLSESHPIVEEVEAEA